MMNAKCVVMGLALAGALFGAAGTARAQVYTPTYMAPRASSDVGVYLSDGPGDLAAEGILRRNFGGYDLGLRLGLVDFDEGASLTIGGELRNPLRVGTAPIDLAFTAGGQGIVGDADAVGFQAGLSIGHTFVGAPLTFTPYIHPRVGLVKEFGDEDFEADLLADLGIDLDFHSNLSLRFGIGLGTPRGGADWGIGLAWR